ncbi:MAG: hypothetical protein ACHQF0_03410 [Chitinophagales bacterium]
MHFPLANYYSPLVLTLQDGRCLPAGRQVHDKATRSYNMSRIRSKNTKPEMLVRKFLHAQGPRYKLHDKKLTGKPDIVLPKYKTVLFGISVFYD